MKRKILHLALVAVTVAGCSQSAAKPLIIQTATIERRDITVMAEATGIIEPINVIEVKSKTASGQVMVMPIEIGTQVNPGDLIVQIDTTDLHTNYTQAASDLNAAQSNFDVAKAVLDRQQKLFADKIITKPDLESAQTTYANSQATLLRNQATLTLAAQKIKDARVIASVTGTIITKPVSVGQVIQAGGGSVSGGTIIATMANLRLVRARALVNETDIGQVQAGQYASVTIDAFPDRPFQGIVEKIEPLATVQQNVTMFPVLISLDNSEGLLKPGMNGEVAILTDERTDVIAVPNDAIRSTREARQAAALLGLNPDTVAAQVMGGGRAGGRNGGAGSAGGAAGGGQKGVQVQINRGELDLPLQGGGDPQGGARQGSGRQGGGRRGGGFQQPQVTDADCKKVDDVKKKKPAVAKKIDDLRTKMRDENADRRAMMADMQKLYAELGTDMRVSSACQRRAEGRGAGGQPGGAGRGGQGSGGRGGQGGAGGGGFTRAQGGQGGGGAGGASSNSGLRSGLVFVQNGATWDAKIIRLGVANYDFTEVLGDGLKEGDKVAMLSAAALQATRQAQIDRQKAGASPFGNAPGGMGGGGPRGGGGRGQ